MPHLCHTPLFPPGGSVIVHVDICVLAGSVGREMPPPAIFILKHCVILILCICGCILVFNMGD